MKEKISLPHFSLLLKKRQGEGFDLRIIVIRGIKRAVDRNRVKRVVREFFRRKMGLLPWGCVVCKVRPEAGKIKNDKLFQELNSIL